MRPIDLRILYGFVSPDFRLVSVFFTGKRRRACDDEKEATLSESSDDGRSALARGMVWATKAGNLGLELALPILGGYWLDQRWGTQPWLLLVGMGLGVLVFSQSVIRL